MRNKEAADAILQEAERRNIATIGNAKTILSIMPWFIDRVSGVLRHQDMMDVVDVSKETVENLLSLLVEIEALGEHEAGGDFYYTANPYVFMKGRPARP